MVLSLSSVTIIETCHTPEEEVTVKICRKVLRKWSLKSNTVIQFKIGSCSKEVLVQSADLSPGEIQIPKKLFETFALPELDGRYLAKYTPNNNTIHVGPIIGLLTDFEINENKEPNFRSIHAFCEELHHGIKETGGFFFVFSLEGFSETGIKGYYHQDGKWVLGSFPLPDVIYNRIHSRKLEYHKIFLSFYKCINSLKIPFFNDRFLSKWEVYNLLVQEDFMHPYLPETKIFSGENLVNMLSQHDTVFVKPVHGSQGRRILKISKEDKIFNIQSSLTSMTDKFIKKESQEAVYEHLKQMINNKIYIVQKGISLTSYHSRTMDFRVLCHKNFQELWEVTSLVARISSEKQFVSNIARGGEIMKPLAALSPIFSRDTAREIISLMKELSIEIAGILSSKTAGLTGELGVDIGVDMAGNLWLIEVNSKPSKNFEEPEKKIRPSARSIIKYCTKLAFEALSEKEE